MNSAYKCKNCNHIFNVGLMPKVDRGSDAPEVNDYSQCYFFGPNDLGRSHQNQPGANGWLPAGSEDMDGPSPNSRMSSLNKKAYSEFWIDPFGKVYPQNSETHADWVIENNTMLDDEYDIVVPYPFGESPELINLLVKQGWTRVTSPMYIKAQFLLHVNNFTNLDRLNDFVAEHFDPNSELPIAVGTDKAHEISVSNPFPSLQKAVNEAKRHPAMSPFRGFMHKQSVLNKEAKILRFEPREGGVEFPVLMNPTMNEALGLLHRSPEKTLRYIPGDNLYIWDAYNADHIYVLDMLSRLGYSLENCHGGEEYFVSDDEIRNYFKNHITGNKKVAHCGPCSVLKMEALHILIDLYYKDNDLFPEEVIEELSLAATELKIDNFNDILESVIEEYLEEASEEVGDKLPKLKNLLIALKDIAPKLGKEIEVVDKQVNVEKEADLKEYSNEETKGINDFIIQHPKIMEVVIDAAKRATDEKSFTDWLQEALMGEGMEEGVRKAVKWEELGWAWFNTVNRETTEPTSTDIIKNLPTLDKSQKLDALLDQLSAETDPQKKERIKQHIERIKNASLNKQAAIRNILIICAGNTCRSPMAENILRSIRPDLNVVSRGLYATEGIKMTQPAEEALKEQGIPYNLHTSKQVSAADVNTADLILVMENWQKEDLVELFPQAKNKTFLIGEAEIVDPVGKTPEEYKKTRDELARALNRFSSLNKKALEVTPRNPKPLIELKITYSDQEAPAVDEIVSQMEGARKKARESDLPFDIESIYKTGFGNELWIDVYATSVEEAVDKINSFFQTAFGQRKQISSLQTISLRKQANPQVQMHISPEDNTEEYTTRVTAQFTANGKEIGNADLSWEAGFEKPKGNKALYLEGIELLPEFRGKGYGREAYNLIADYAKKKGFKRVDLSSEGEAARFWEHLKFKPFGGKKDPGYPYREYTKKLSNIDVKANPPSRFWIAPDGTEYDAGSHHGVWIKTHKQLLDSLGINTSTVGYTWDALINGGWVRVSNEPAGSGFQIQVKDVKNLPSFLDDFVAKHFSAGNVVEVGDQSGNLARVYDPFPSLQKAVNRSLSLRQAASLNLKQAALLDEVLDQTTQDAIAAEYGPQMLIALRFYNDAVRYGQSPDRATAYALEETKRMKRPIEQGKFLEVLNTYFNQPQEMGKQASLPTRMTSDEMREWLMEHGETWEGPLEYGQVKEMIPSMSEWILQDIPLSNFPHWTDFEGMKIEKRNPLPIVTLGPDFDWEVLDGKHRIAVANALEEKSIKGYVFKDLQT